MFPLKETSLIILTIILIVVIGMLISITKDLTKVTVSSTATQSMKRDLNSYLQNDTIPLSQVNCKGDLPRHKRCVFNNVIVSKGIIKIVSNSPKKYKPPAILCSAVTKTVEFKVRCKSEVISKAEALEILHQEAPVYPIHNALVYGRLEPSNPYHSLFEDFIPIFEILTLYRHYFSHWLDIEPVADSVNDAVIFVDQNHHINKDNYSFRFWKRFFPHVQFIDKINGLKNTYVVNNLVAGGNSSCVHYYHCSRDSYTTPGIAVAFRQFILAKVGISFNEQLEVDKFTKIPSYIEVTSLNGASNVIVRNDTVGDDITPRLVTIIQRKPDETRRILNLPEVESVCNSVFGGRSGQSPCVVKQFSSMSLDDQIIQIYSSDVIICIHGGAVGNLLFSRNRSTVIDIYPYSFPYSFHGLINWIRSSLSDSMFIGHAPFETVSPHYMHYTVSENTTTTLPTCLCNTTTRVTWFNCAFTDIFYRCAGIKVNVSSFQDHLTSAMNVWKQRQLNSHLLPSVDEPPRASRSSFKNFSLSYAEPWYYPEVRASYVEPVGVSLPDCSRVAKSLWRGN